MTDPLSDIDNSDRNFLIWLHDRLTNVHGENELYGYMHRLRKIIVAMPPTQRSFDFGHNDMESLKNALRK